MFSNWISRENRITGINYNHILYVCVLLACLVPRYISNFKIHVGINISIYTIFVVAVFLLTVRGIKIYKRVEFWFFGIWAALIILNFFRAEMMGVWLYYLDWIVTALLFQQILISHWDEDSWDHIVRGMTDALFIHLLMGIYELYTGSYIFNIGSLSSLIYGKVAIGMFYNLNDYITFVTTIMPFAAYRFIRSQSVIERFYSGFITLLSMYMIYVNESRGAWLAFGVICIALLLVLIRKMPKVLLVIIAGVLLLGLIVMLNIFGLRSMISNFISGIFSGAERSDDARINLIKNGLYFLGITKGFGVGAGNLFKWLSEKSIYSIGRLAMIHNWYAEILVTFGVGFFILYVIFHIKVLYKLWSDNYGRNMLKTTMFISFVGFSVVSISSSSNVYSEWVWMYLVLLSTYVITLDETVTETGGEYENLCYNLS